MNGKINQNLQLAEHINQKINTDAGCDAKAMFMQQFDQAEQVIIERSKLIRGMEIDVWKPERAIVK